MSRSYLVAVQLDSLKAGRSDYASPAAFALISRTLIVHVRPRAAVATSRTRNPRSWFDRAGSSGGGCSNKHLNGQTTVITVLFRPRGGISKSHLMIIVDEHLLNNSQGLDKKYTASVDSDRSRAPIVCYNLAWVRSHDLFQAESLS